jgi:hypothetical protein
VIKALLLCFVIGGLGVGYVWQQQQVNVLGQKIHRSESRLEDLIRQSQKLGQVLATLQSTRSLEEQVKKLNLGLVPPSPDQVWHISERGTNSTAIYAPNLEAVKVAQAAGAK